MPIRWLTVATFTLVVAACAPAPTAPTASTGPASTTTGPKLHENQTLTVGLNAIPSTWDPMVTLGSNPRRYGTFDSLVGQNDDGTIKPGIAKEWKALSDTRWQFTLDTTRKWHDGAPVTADDVVFSYNRAVDPANKFAILSRTGAIKGAEKLDAQNIVVNTAEPDPILLKRAYMVPILPKLYIERVGDKEFDSKPIGSGPFKVIEWVANDRAVLERNPEHPDKPTLTKLTVKVIPEPTARLAGLRTGELDIVNQLGFDQLEIVKNGGFDTVVFDTGYSWGAWMDTLLPDSPTKDKRVRQAIQYAIDKDAIVRTIYRGLTIPEQGQIVQKESFGFNPNLKPYPYDPKKARELLAAAGYPNGFKMKLDAYGFNAEARQTWVYVQSQLKEVGIEADLNAYSDSASNADRFYGRVQRSPITGVSLINTPAADADFAIVWFSSSQVGGSKRYDNPEFERLYKASTTEMNETKRKELLQGALAVMHEDPPYLFLVQGGFLWAKQKNIEGLTKRVDVEPDYAKVRRLAN